MKILAFESSAKAASCAILENGEVLATAWQATGLTHSRTLLPMAEDMLKNCELSVQDIDAIAVAAGPGSFTGLRIGAAAVKGLAWAAEKPCIPVPTLEAMAWPLAHLEGLIVCTMDARRQQIYNAVFLADGGTLTRLREDRAISLAEAAGDLAEMDDGPMYIVGDGAELCCNYLQLQGVACRMAPAHLRLQSAVGVGMAAQRLWPDGAVTAQDLSLTYLRLSQAERERAARSAAGTAAGRPEDGQ